MKRIAISGDIATVQLTRGKFAIIDAADAAVIGRWNWYAKTSKRGTHFYACRTIRADGKKTESYMHVELHGKPPPKMVVDHEDRDTLNNRRGNLRAATYTQNSNNNATRSATPRRRGGVYFLKRESRFNALLNLGYFETKVAAEAYLLEVERVVLEMQKDRQPS